MKLQGNVNIRAPRQRVWEFLIDPNAVARCAPGVESLDIVEPGKKFKVVATIGFGTVKVKFNTDVELAELQAPSFGKIKAHGAAPGSAVDVATEITLTDAADRTTDVAWVADVSVVGSIAAMANRLMGSVTQNLSGRFFDCMKSQVEVAEGVVEVETPAAKPGFLRRIIDAIRRFFARLFGSSTDKQKEG
jgi:carbon monoxide dehydrogenase subunit G